MNDPVASLYIQLSHPQYKALEEQLLDWKARETAHTSVDGFYHKSISFIVVGIRWEFHGPNVKAAEPVGPKLCFAVVPDPTFANRWGYCLMRTGHQHEHDTRNNWRKLEKWESAS